MSGTRKDKKAKVAAKVATKSATQSATKKQPLREQIDELNAEMKGYRAEIVILRNNFDRAKIEKELGHDMDMDGIWQAANIKLVAELKSHQDSSSDNENVVELNKRLADTEKELGQKTKDLQNITDESNVKDGRLTKLSEECQRLKTEIASQNSQFPSVQDLRVVKNDYEGQLESLRKELQKAGAKISHHENKLPDILGRSQQSEDYKALQAKLDIKQSEFEAHELEIHQLTNIMTTMKGDLSKQETENEEANKHKSQLEQERKTLTTQLSKAKSHVDVLEEKIRTLEHDRDAQHVDRGGTTEQAEVITRLKAELQQKSLDLDKQHGQFVGEIDEKTSLIADLEKQKRKYEAQVRSLLDNQNEVNEVNDLREELTNEKTAHVKTKKKVEELERLDNQNELKDLREELTKEKSAHVKTKKRVEELERLDNQNELKDLREELTKEKSAHGKTKKKVDELESACHDAFVKLEVKDKLAKQSEENHKELITRKEKTINELHREATKIDPTSGNTNEELRKLREENQHLTNRLSKMAGDKLLDGNPNIADLSDENRATKLGEKFSELYDNEWTDAYEECEKKKGGEVSAIKYLHDLLLDIHGYCQKLSKDHAENLISALLSLPDHNFKAENVPMAPSKSKQLKDIRKTFAKDVTDTVAQCYVKDRLPDLSSMSKTQKYIQQCAELCWLMSVQDPPVIINTAAVDKSGKLNKDMFRIYTKSGPKVDYVVWPPLVLHENGPLICKGVAQAK